MVETLKGERSTANCIGEHAWNFLDLPGGALAMYLTARF